MPHDFDIRENWGNSLRRFCRAITPARVWKGLHLWKVRRLQMQFQPYITTQRFGGVNLRLQIADPQAKDWYGRGGNELKEIELLKTGQLKPGAIVFDLGAHQGVVALQIANIVGEAGRVIAVEANPHHAKVAQSNCQLNNAENIFVEHAAVAAAPGVVTVSRDWDGQLIGTGDTTVTATTVDELARKHGSPQVLYIDVEGYECEVLMGASNAIKSLPDLYIEVHSGCGLESFGGSIDRLFGLLPVNVYRFFAIRPAGMHSDEDLICEYNSALEWIGERFYLVGISTL